MSRFSDKGYHVKENAPIYFTKDMIRTAQWFEEIIGWYSNIVERNEDGQGCYGVVFKGWDKITEVAKQPWGGKTCSLTTIDGYVINIFE